MPKRIQRKRTKGWRMPANTIYVGRPTRYGNPFLLSAFKGDRKKLLRLYRAWITNTRFTPKHIEEICGNGATVPMSGKRNNALAMLQYQIMSSIVRRDYVPELRGKDLACWCPLGQPCHADVLLELANGAQTFAGDRT